ncbi:chitinase [Paraburkholderia sp. SOS3]|uniref:chitinase n=1 Tax=Paraburkholderia sp. SOS3 TaxID=1926494 RepID=UPI0022B3EBAD|nr:chitinase [Paraburkholderia sp. SOS3]
MVAQSQGRIEILRDALRVLPDSDVDAVVPGRAANPSNVKRVESIVSEQKFNELFPIRNIAYSYVNLLRGIAKFPAYCGDYKDGRDANAICRKLLATSFAHFVQETGANWPSLTPAQARSGYPDHNNPVLATMPQDAAIPTWRQALWYLRESGYEEGSAVGAYQQCAPGSHATNWIFYACAKNSKGQYLDYFGRGAKQLSWNYNFGPFSQALYGDPNVLLDNPGRVADTWLNFASAIWFAVTPQTPKPPMTWVIDGTWKPNNVDLANNMKPGFGATVYIINGGIECGGGGAERSQVQNRIAAYKEMARELNVTIPSDEPLGCANMRGFTEGSAAATQAYLDKDYAWANGKPVTGCKLVDYQMPFSLITPGDYKACTDYFFRGKVEYNGQTVIDNTK